MRLALVSDIHGNLPALEAVAADIERRGVDAVVNLGDNLSGPLLPRQTAQFLMARGWPTLAGNHDRALLADNPALRSPADDHALAELTAAELSWLATLPPTLRWSPEVFLCHGTPKSDLQYFFETVESGAVRLAREEEIESRRAGEASPVIACGHTHMPRALRNAVGQLLVNPGSVGLQAYLDDDPPVHVVETGTTDARYAIVEQTAGRWTALLLAVPYDFKSMAVLAGRNGRPDWQHALLSGRAFATA
jgi:predicted phosphodiesterase